MPYDIQMIGGKMCCHLGTLMATHPLVIPCFSQPRPRRLLVIASLGYRFLYVCVSSPCASLSCRPWETSHLKSQCLLISNWISETLNEKFQPFQNVEFLSFSVNGSGTSALYEQLTEVSETKLKTQYKDNSTSHQFSTLQCITHFSVHLCVLVSKPYLEELRYRILCIGGRNWDSER